MSCIPAPLTGCKERETPPWQAVAQRFSKSFSRALCQLLPLTPPHTACQKKVNTLQKCRHCHAPLSRSTFTLQYTRRWWHWGTLCCSAWGTWSTPAADCTAVCEPGPAPAALQPWRPAHSTFNPAVLSEVPSAAGQAHWVLWLVLHPWGFSRPSWAKPWATWSELTADPAHCRRLDWRHPKVPSRLNGVNHVASPYQIHTALDNPYHQCCSWDDKVI